MNCCICNGEIEVHGTWTEGHNAEPLKDGRCCDKCNNKVVNLRLRILRGETCAKW